MVSKKAVAYHEAGHAVANVILRIPFDNVSIIPGDNCHGITILRASKRFMEILRGDDYSDASAAWMERSIISSLAGPESERLFTGSYNKIGADDDWNDAEEMASRLNANPNELLGRAISLVKENQPEIEAVADALLVEGTLGARAVRRIIREVR